MISYFFLFGSLRGTSYKILVPPTHRQTLGYRNGLPKWPKPWKLCSFSSATIRPRDSLREKSRASGPGAGVKWGWANKSTFSLFLCFVCEVFLAAWSNVAGSFYGKVRIFRFICWCNVSSLYFLHKLWNETAYLICAWWRDPGWESWPVCALYGGE